MGEVGEDVREDEDEEERLMLSAAQIISILYTLASPEHVMRVTLSSWTRIATLAHMHRSGKTELDER